MTTPLSAVRVLLVDDNQHMRSIVATVLAAWPVSMMIGRKGLGLSAALRTSRVNSTPSIGDIWKSTMAMSAGHWRRASSASAPSQHSRRCCTPTPARTVATIERICWLSSTSSTRTADRGVVI